MLLPHRHPCCHPRRLAGKVLKRSRFYISSLFFGFSSPVFASHKVYDIQCPMYGSIDVQQQLANDHHRNTKTYIYRRTFTAHPRKIMSILAQDWQEELVHLFVLLPGRLYSIEHRQMDCRDSLNFQIRSASLRRCLQSSSIRVAQYSQYSNWRAICANEDNPDAHSCSCSFCSLQCGGRRIVTGGSMMFFPVLFFTSAQS